jgi:serine/threonine-protein kinase
VTDKDVGSAATMPGRTSTVPSLSDAGAPSLIAERYAILGLLGIGGMGRVYRAHDQTLDEIVALKLLRREIVDVRSIERFRQEVKLARRVTSPHVVRTFDVGVYGDDHFLTMEYIDGRSLAQLVDRGPLPLPEILRIAGAACAGMTAAHAAGILHRDLKPDNLLVAKDGRIAITDFGIARPATSGTTAAGEGFIGTPAYMAPEQVTGDAEIGPPADVYAFGAILFELLAGRRPFVGGDAIQVALARLVQPVPDPRAHRPVPDALAALVMRCMAREPRERFADGAALATALAAIELSTTTALPIAASPRVPHRTARSVAVLPLRATAELTELADGLSEEIVDALAMTRALRVRPLVSVRKAHGPDADPQDTGRALGIDVIVDGTLRKLGDSIRITARAIGIADGFQLWANRFDVAPDGLLVASDQIARAVASALTVELLTPDRQTSDPRAMALYLEAKAKLRTGWYSGDLTAPVRELEAASLLAPDDPAIHAALAIALCRQSFASAAALPRAIAIAEGVVAKVASNGEAWLALGLARVFEQRPADAMEGLIRAVTHAPGYPLAQGVLGSVLLEAGLLDEAIAHLEAAHALDPVASISITDLSRAYFYAGRTDDAFATARGGGRDFRHASQIARMQFWLGNRVEADMATVAGLPPWASFHGILRRAYASDAVSDEDLAALDAGIRDDEAGAWAARSQFLAELLVRRGDVPRALDVIAFAVDHGLHDRLWCERCPVLAPLHDDPRFRELAATVAARARDVVAAFRAALSGAEDPDRVRPPSSAASPLTPGQ